MQTSKETILPILQFKENIVKTITDNPVTIICGQTGCGKTTQVPQYIIKSDPNANVIVTQPRRLAAISVSERVAFQLGVKLGTLVGYHIGMDCKVSNRTRISYVTTGILLEKLTNDPKFLETYSHIIFDQVHQRGIQCDFSLIAIKLNLCRKIKNNLRIIVMSATLNSELFSKFFGRNEKGEFIKAQIQIKTKQKQVRRGDRRRYQSSDDQMDYTSSLQIKENDKLAPCVILPTLRRFNITIKYLQDFSQNPSSSGQTPYFDDYKVNMAIKLCQQNISLGDILIFVPGMRQIKMISNAINSKTLKCKLFQLHSQFSTSVQQLFAATQISKIIVSTNIAESSITLPDVKVIIDFCMSKQHQYNQKTNFQRLELVWASKASMIQRAGRVGRVSDGTVYRLICKNQYDSSQEYDLSQMKRSSLQKTILRIKKLDALTLKEQLTIFSDVYQVLANAFESPQVKRIDKTIQKLIFQEALIVDESTIKKCFPKYLGAKLTMSQLGKYIVQMPCDIHLAKMLIVAATLGVHEQMIDIVAIMCYKKPFFVNFDKRQNPQNYVHYIFNYDENEFNDFSAKQRLFVDWMQMFFFPWKRNNFYKFEMKQKVQQNKQQEDMYYQIYKNVLIDSSFLINNFISQKVDQKQITWCTQRCVWSNNFRDILSLRENIRAKVSRNLNINYPEKAYSYDIQNILELLCLFIGFKNNMIEIILERNSSYSIDNQQNKDLDLSLLLTDVKFTEEDLYKFITQKSNTQFSKIDIKKTYSNIRVTGGLKYLAKLKLPFKYRKTSVPREIVSQVFSHLTANQPFYEYKFSLKQKKHGRSVIVDDQSLNKAQFYSGSFQGYLLTNEFMQSTRGLLAKNTAWISSDQTVILLIAFSQSVKFIWNKSQQFFTYLIADEIKYQLPFYLNKKLLQTLQILRKTIKNIFDINNNKKIDYQKLINTITFLMDDCQIIQPLPKIQTWQELYAEQLGFKSRHDKYSEQIDQLSNIPEIPNNYHIKYKKWKRSVLKQMQAQISQFKYDYCIFACKHCLPEINIVCTLDNIDKQKKIVIEKQSTSEWIVRDNQLYCRGSAGHSLGHIIDQNTPIIDCEKNLVLRYPNGQVKQVLLYEMDFKNIQNQQKSQKKWIKQKQTANKTYECRICYEQGYHHTEESYNVFKKHTLKHRDKERLFKQFM